MRRSCNGGIPGNPGRPLLADGRFCASVGSLLVRFPSLNLPIRKNCWVRWLRPFTVIELSSWFGQGQAKAARSQGVRLSQLSCPHCGHSISFAVEQAGKVVSCPQCYGHLQMPLRRPLGVIAGAVGVFVILGTPLVLTCACCSGCFNFGNGSGQQNAATVTPPEAPPSQSTEPKPKKPSTKPKKASAPPVEPPKLQMDAPPKKIASTQKSPVTLGNFYRVKIGMSKDEVLDILGDRCELSSLVEIRGRQMAIVTWRDDGFLGGNCNVTFQNGEVIAKAQFGLKGGENSAAQK